MLSNQASRKKEKHMKLVPKKSARTKIRTRSNITASKHVMLKRTELNLLRFASGEHFPSSAGHRRSNDICHV